MKKTQRSFNSTLRPRTEKTARRNRTWQEICLDRINFIIGKYGNLICEYCGERGGLGNDSPLDVWGHHIDGERDNCQMSNCYICHHSCHHYIHEHHTEVRQEDFQGKIACQD